MLLLSALASVLGLPYFVDPRGLSVAVALVVLLLLLPRKTYRRLATVFAVSSGLVTGVVVFEFGYFIWVFLIPHSDFVGVP